MHPPALFGATFGGALYLLLWVCFVVVSFVTWVKIISKAGYSGWWMMVPVSAIVCWLAAIVIGVGSFIDTLRSNGAFGSGTGLDVPGRFNSPGLDVAAVLGIISLILFIATWILFVVFGFSNWPALRKPINGPGSSGGRSENPLPFSPGPGDAPGWHQVGATNNDQAYWDGQGWTARKRWEGAGWVDVPLVRSHPQP